jgi:hypothetical protein
VSSLEDVSTTLKTTAADGQFPEDISNVSSAKADDPSQDMSDFFADMAKPDKEHLPATAATTVTTVTAHMGSTVEGVQSFNSEMDDSEGNTLKGVQNFNPADNTVSDRDGSVDGISKLAPAEAAPEDKSDDSLFGIALSSDEDTGEDDDDAIQSLSLDDDPPPSSGPIVNTEERCAGLIQKVYRGHQDRAEAKKMKTKRDRELKRKKLAEQAEKDRMLQITRDSASGGFTPKAAAARPPSPELEPEDDVESEADRLERERKEEEERLLEEQRKATEEAKRIQMEKDQALIMKSRQRIYLKKIKARLEEAKIEVPSDDKLTAILETHSDNKIQHAYEDLVIEQLQQRLESEGGVQVVVESGNMSLASDDGGRVHIDDLRESLAENGWKIDPAFKELKRKAPRGDEVSPAVSAAFGSDSNGDDGQFSDDGEFSLSDDLETADVGDNGDDDDSF